LTDDDDFTDNNQILILPVRSREEAARGTEIQLASDRLQVLDHWAQAGQTAQVGISVAEGQQQIEYWLPIQLHPIADEPLETYLAALNNEWQEVLAGLAPMIIQHLVRQDIEYRICFQNPLSIEYTQSLAYAKGMLGGRA
jgi:hypothetical protein